LARFEDVLSLMRTRREMAMLIEVESGVRLVHFAPGRIEFEPAPGAAPDLAARLAERLQAWTGRRWGVSVVSGGGRPSLAEARAQSRHDAAATALDNPLVQAVMAAFPGARVADIRPSAGAAAAAPAADARDDAGDGTDDWDPFEDR
jgi:DNA polymerase-3 subunit gamma/tau